MEASATRAVSVLVLGTAEELCRWWHLLGTTGADTFLDETTSQRSSGLCLLSFILYISLAPLSSSSKGMVNEQLIVFAGWRDIFLPDSSAQREGRKKKRKQNPVGVVKYQSYLRYREMKFWGSLILFFTVGVPVEWDLLVISIIQIIKVS